MSLSDELAYLAEAATATFAVDFTNIDSGGDGDHLGKRCFLIVKMAMQRGWTSAEFHHAVDQFIARTKFPTWTIADFFDAYKQPKVYGHAWFREQWPKHGAEKIGTYDVHGNVAWGLRSECDGLLPEWEGEHVPDEPPTESEPSDTPKKDFMDPETRARFNDVMSNLKKSVELEGEELARRRSQTNRPSALNEASHG